MIWSIAVNLSTFPADVADWMETAESFFGSIRKSRWEKARGVVGGTPLGEQHPRDFFDFS
jgi:hypothetical protein